MLYSCTCSERLLRKSTPCSQHSDIQSDTLAHICANMQSDRTDCNQTLAKHKHSHSFFVSLARSLTHTYTHINAVAQCTNICHFISRSHTNKKGENNCMLFTKRALRYRCSSKCQIGNEYLSIGCDDHKQC